MQQWDDILTKYLVILQLKVITVEEIQKIES